MISDAIRKFSDQLAWTPTIEQKEKLIKPATVVVAGMGGSRLAADLLTGWDQGLQIRIHANYGLPELPKRLHKKTLVIASSYSGNTEEVISAFDAAIEQKLAVAALTTGGALREKARKYGVPYVQMPDWRIQPRSAVGLSTVGLLALLGKSRGLKELAQCAKKLKPELFESQGKGLAEELQGSIPIIYTSQKNAAIAYNWKIRFNETGKIPAFHNQFPELNHNELIGFDRDEPAKKLSDLFYIIMLRDMDDHPNIQLRMELTAELYREKGLRVKVLDMRGKTPWEKIFSSLLTADWTALYIAEAMGLDAEQVDLVEEFKKRLQERRGA